MTETDPAAAASAPQPDASPAEPVAAVAPAHTPAKEASDETGPVEPPPAPKKRAMSAAQRASLAKATAVSAKKRKLPRDEDGPQVYDQSDLDKAVGRSLQQLIGRIASSYQPVPAQRPDTPAPQRTPVSTAGPPAAVMEHRMSAQRQPSGEYQQPQRRVQPVPTVDPRLAHVKRISSLIFK